MASTTGIELGSESCVLVSVRPGRAGTGDVLALHTIGRSEWPANSDTRADVLRSVRRAERLPHRAAVVVWGLPDDAADDASTRAVLRPLEAAGFRVESILTPPQALARLAGMRPRQDSADAVVWLALNMHGVAIGIVRSGELLFARTFPWKYNRDLTETKAQLLQRYSLIAHLAPEVRHGIAIVRASQGASVDAVVTCGDLPELRSLTMPLIEELDLEVETLDSPDGLRAARNVTPERLMEAAPAIRLACAAALPSALTPSASKPIGATSRREEPSGTRRATAAVALVAALAWGVYAYSNVFTSSAVRPMPVPLGSAPARPAQASVKAEPKLLPPPSATSSERKPAPQPPAVKDESKPVSTVLSVRKAPKPVPTAPPPLNARPTPVPSGPPQTVVPRPAVPLTTERVDSKPAPPALQAERRSQPVPATPSSTLRTAPEEQTDASTDMRSGVSPSVARLTPGTRYVPLKDPLPQVDSILIDQERRLAIIDGVVVGVGDAVGPRSVIQIDSDAVDLREPSGLLVRVHLRPKFPR
jgi:hypothetical protein